MKKNEIICSILMETTTNPVQPQDVQVIDKNGLYYVKFYTNLQDFDVKNRNGRIYEGVPMMEGLNADHIQELIREGAWLGEYGHPLDNNMSRVLTIDPKLASHRILSLDVTNKGAKGWIETLTDGYGRSFTNNILQGMEPAFSLRALASVTRTGGNQIIKSKPRIVTYDAVILPSHKIAYRDKSTNIETKIISGGRATERVMESSSNTMNDSPGIIVRESQIIDFIKEESQNYKLISNIYEVCSESITLSKDLKNVILTEGDTRYSVRIEDKISHDIDNFMAKF